MCAVNLQSYAPRLSRTPKTAHFIQVVRISTEYEHEKTALIFAAASAAFAGAAHAQSSVTLYGLVDAGLTYVSNEATRNSPITPNGLTDGKAVFGMTSGNVRQSRWGMRGVEDLGGGLKPVF